MKPFSVYILAPLIAALVFAGCATQSRTVVAKDGTTTTTKTTAFLQTIQGFSDSAVSPDGILYTTTIQNMTGDVQMVTAIDQLIQHSTALVLMASGNTNLIGTNLVSVLGPKMVFSLKRPAR